MSEPKPLASLGGHLLARKGAARPAMRPQVQRLAIEAIAQDDHLEDLGWDDMGDAGPAPVRYGEVLALTPEPVNPEARQEAEADDREAAAQLARHNHHHSPEKKPEVARQQDIIAQKLEATPAPTPARTAPRKSATANGRKALPKAEKGRKAAFTLRLDEDRHLKLRLACTIQGRSAQQLVTRALDRLLDEIPELELLAAQVNRRGKTIAN